MEKIKYQAPYALSRAKEGDIGYDLRSIKTVYIPEGKSELIRTGVRLELKYPYYADLRPRSSTGKRGLMVDYGTIDSGYRGEILIRVWNMTDEPITIKRFHRIAQLVIQKDPDVEMELTKEIDDDTERGTGGFGSTGL